jgi:pimeloyl-ACP methyl ester carboxylesterase
VAVGPKATESGATARIVLLPGAYTRAADFAAAGFAEAVRERDLAIELVAADLEFGSMTDRSMLQRLRSGPLQDARVAGCQSVWFAGVSLGGFVALAFAERFPGEVDGLCLIAPYLGTRIVAREIDEAGGLARWKPEVVAEDDEERRIWRFIQSNRRGRPALYLGYGRQDRFADSQRLLAEALSPTSVDVVDGGHDWPAWRRLWARFLDKWPASGRRSSVGPLIR